MALVVTTVFLARETASRRLLLVEAINMDELVSGSCGICIVFE